MSIQYLALVPLRSPQPGACQPALAAVAHVQCIHLRLVCSLKKVGSLREENKELRRLFSASARFLSPRRPVPFRSPTTRETKRRTCQSVCRPHHCRTRNIERNTTLQRPLVVLDSLMHTCLCRRPPTLLPPLSYPSPFALGMHSVRPGSAAKHCDLAIPVSCVVARHLPVLWPRPLLLAVCTPPSAQPRQRTAALPSPYCTAHPPPPLPPRRPASP